MRIPLIAVLAVLVVHVPEVFGQAWPLELQGLFRIPSDERLPRLQIPSVFRQDRASEAPVVRGQNPQTFETPAITPPAAGGMMPFQGGDLRDPFLYGDPVLGGQPDPPVPRSDPSA